MASCDFITVSRDEVVRLPSPGGKIDAIVVETNGGATTSFGYEVHIVPHGSKPGRYSKAASLYGAVRNSSAYGVNLLWLSRDRLAVQYDTAKLSKLNRANFEIDGDRVSVELHSGKPDPDSPAGGMEYNLNKGRSH